jgi:hypothetical protein
MFLRYEKLLFPTNIFKIIQSKKYLLHFLKKLLLYPNYKS